MHELSMRRAFRALAGCVGALLVAPDLAAAPAMKVRYIEVGVSLSREIVEKALRTMEPELTACVLRHATGKSPLIGFELMTLPSGKVDSAGSMGWNHLDDSPGNPALNCLRDVLIAWRFPRAARFGLAAFHLSWTLSPSDLPARRPRK